MVSGQESVASGKESAVSGQELVVSGQESEARGQEEEVRDQKPARLSQFVIPDLPFKPLSFPDQVWDKPRCLPLPHSPIPISPKISFSLFAFCTAWPREWLLNAIITVCAFSAIFCLENPSLEQTNNCCKNFLSLVFL